MSEEDPLSRRALICASVHAPPPCTPPSAVRAGTASEAPPAASARRGRCSDPHQHAAEAREVEAHAGEGEVPCPSEVSLLGVPIRSECRKRQDRVRQSQYYMCRSQSIWVLEDASPGCCG
jgi:hypothetical protein